MGKVKNIYREINHWANEHLTNGLDKLVHFFVGALIAIAALNITGIVLVALLAPIVVGALNESLNKNFDILDFFSWAVSGVVVCVVATVFGWL